VVSVRSDSCHYTKVYLCCSPAACFMSDKTNKEAGEDPHPLLKKRYLKENNIMKKLVDFQGSSDGAGYRK